MVRAPTRHLQRLDFSQRPAGRDDRHDSEAPEPAAFGTSDRHMRFPYGPRLPRHKKRATEPRFPPRRGFPFLVEQRCRPIQVARPNAWIVCNAFLWSGALAAKRRRKLSLTCCRQGPRTTTTPLISYAIIASRSLLRCTPPGHSRQARVPSGPRRHERWRAKHWTVCSTHRRATRNATPASEGFSRGRKSFEIFATKNADKRSGAFCLKQTQPAR